MVARKQKDREEGSRCMMGRTTVIKSSNQVPLPILGHEFNGL